MFTIYSTFAFHGFIGYFMVMAASGVQLVALLWYLVSFLPGGAASLRYLTATIGHLLKPVFLACGRCQAYCLANCFSWMAKSAVSS